MKPYYADDSVTLWHGDWRELIAPDFRADLIVTDPPYGETSLEWDRWPKGWPTLAARHSDSMWCFGSMRMFLDQRDEFADWKLSQDIVWAGVHHEAPTERTNGPLKGRAINRGPTRHYGKQGEVGWIDEGERILHSVLEHPNMHGRAINETEKPVPLLEPLIQYGCPIGGTVLDLHAGSASTLVAARNMGRRAVGYEIREGQCEEAAKRLSQGVLDFGDAS